MRFGRPLTERDQSSVKASHNDVGSCGRRMLVERQAGDRSVVRRSSFHPLPMMKSVDIQRFLCSFYT